MTTRDSYFQPEAARAAAMGRHIADLTPAGVAGSPTNGFLVNQNDAGAAVALPVDHVAFVQVFVDAAATGAVAVVGEVTVDPALGWTPIWNSQNLTGANTTDGFEVQNEDCLFRIRRTDNLGTGNVHGVMVWG